MLNAMIKMSEAAAIGLHAADYLARRRELSSAQSIAEELKVSYNHLSKVLQQLTRAGLVKPTRGPAGGFTLSPAGRTASVRDFLTAIDGPIKSHDCLMGAHVCRRQSCIFGGFIAETNARFEAALDRKISEFSKRK